MNLHKAEIVGLEPVSLNWNLLTIRPEEKAEFGPGQFIYLRLSPMTDPLLRRPFSVHGFCKSSNHLEVLFQDKGKGTRLMKGYRSGDEIDFLGPLGNGFNLSKIKKKAALVGGGIGVAPLFFLAHELHKSGVSFDFLMGASTKEVIPSSGYFEKHQITPYLATDDGSSGFQGTVTALFKNLYGCSGENKELDMVYACGPTPMLKTLYNESESLQIPIEVSLEANMACGVGACLGCVCRLKEENSPQETYGRVCKEGPVFPGEAVFFSER